MSGGPPFQDNSTPPELSARDYVTYLLSIDAEIEHCLMVQYLYAGYSLGGSQIPPELRNVVRNWQETILGIAKEEMGHLITVQNVLRLIGSPLHFERNDYPWDTPFYPFPFELEPLTLDSLAKYVYAEAPAGWEKCDCKLVKEICDRVNRQTPCPHHVSELFNKLIPLVNSLPDEVFQADTYRCQADFAEWGRGYQGGQRGSSNKRSLEGTPDVLVMPLTSRDDTVNALNAIAQQGEASYGTNPSHFVRFLRIYVEMCFALEGRPYNQEDWNAARPHDFLGQAWKNAYPKKQMDELQALPTTPTTYEATWRPSRSVAVNPYVLLNTDLEPEQSGTRTTAITEPVTALWASLFNLRYRMLLQYLIHSFTLYDGLRAAGQFTPRGSIINAAFGEMYNLRALSEILMQLPVSTEQNALLAGPPFEVPYTLDSPFGEANLWRGHLDLLAASEKLVSDLLQQADAAHRPYLRNLREADKSITAIARRNLSGDVDPALL
jgi:hypothetical protein